MTDLDAGGAGGDRRPFGSTGWFGVGSSDSGPAEVGLDGRRPQSSVRIGGGDRPDRLVSAGSSGGARPASPVDNVAARPYAWIPAAPIADDDEPAPPPDRPLVLLKPRNWPWIIAALAFVAVVVWLVVPRPPPSGYADAQTRRYLEAVALCDNGHGELARSEFVKLAKEPDPRAEIYLHLAVIDLEARRFAAARRTFEAYLSHPRAIHVERARKLAVHAFGPAAVQSGARAP